jgi:hypothetical protein
MPTKSAIVFRSPLHAALLVAMGALLVLTLFITLDAISYGLWWLLDTFVRWVLA